MEEGRRGNVGSGEGGLQGKEQVGAGKHAAEGEKDEGRARIRRATFDDLKAIMDINDDIYEGFDYMPALFYTFMHSKLHIIYVHEEDGKLVSLYNCRFHPDRDDLISGMSGRVRPSYLGRGLGSSEAAPLRAHVEKEHPKFMRVIGDTMYTANIATKMKKWKLLYHWNILAYKLPDRQWLSRFAHIRQMALGALRPFSLSYTDGIEWLERSDDQLVRFISRYVGDFFPIAANWMPTPTNRSGLRHMLSVAKVLVTMDPASITDNSCSSDNSSNSGLHPANGTQNTRNKMQEGAIIGLSLSTVLTCKYGIRVDINFYGDCENILLSHVYSHLVHYVSIASEDVRLGVIIHFPLTIDVSNVEERLKEDMGGRLHNSALPVTQAVQYMADMPRAKL